MRRPPGLDVVRDSYDRVAETLAAAPVTELELAESSLAGVMGWWSLFNLPRDVLPKVLSSFSRALMPGGWLIVATHVGSDDLARTEGYGAVPVTWTTYPWQPEQLTALTEQRDCSWWPSSGSTPTAARYSAQAS